MSIIVKNKTGGAIELTCFGIELAEDEVRDIFYCYRPSEEFNELISSGGLVYVQNDFVTELSVEETREILEEESKPVYQQSKGGVFGTNFAYAESLSVTTRTSSDLSDKVVLPVSVIDANSGLYRIGWAYQWSTNTTSKDFYAEISLQDSDGGNKILLGVHQQEPKEAGGSYISTGTDQKHTSSGMKYRNLLVGDYEIIIQYCGTDKKSESSIWNATVEFWRVQ